MCEECDAGWGEMSIEDTKEELELDPEMLQAAPANIPLLRSILQQIDRDPSSWDQTAWGVRTDCGTAYCIAGHACVMTNRHVRWEQDKYDLSVFYAQFTVDGRDIEDAASDALGLTQREADLLFDAYRSREQIQVIAEHIARRSGETL